MHELPQTYSQCKTYTKNFQGWLLKTARSRGLDIDKYVKEEDEYALRIYHIVPIAEEIAKSGKPLEDPSGMRDLDDAIRTRNEVTAWYNHKGKGDKTHPFFILNLKSARDVLLGLFRRDAKKHDIPDERSTAVCVIAMETSKDDASNDDTPNEEEIVPLESKVLETTAAFSKKRKKKDATTTIRLTPQEMILEQDFQVLCFLYDFNQLRDLVRGVWETYKSRGVSIVTAALVTDLALAILRRNTDALIAEFEEVDTGRSLAVILDELYEAASTPKQPTTNVEEAARATSLPTHPTSLLERFCIEALRHLEAYQQLKYKRPAIPDPANNAEDLPFMPFLLFFDGLQETKFMSPVMDIFTEAIQASATGSEPWLIFGLQIMIDVQKAVHESSKDVLNDVMEGMMRTADLMKAHITYEDDMWKLKTPPDYMSVGEKYFSNLFLDPFGEILRWMNQVTNYERATKNELEAYEFLSVHPVLSGLTLYHYEKFYQVVSITKIQWFMVAFAYLYNACRQIGGLDIPWPDLEYIISMHGEKRIFIGERPADPQLFYDRLLLGLAVSSRGVTQDHIQRSKQTWRPLADKAVRAKRGLLALFPLQQRIRDYYYHYTADNRWIRLHNVFAHAFEAAYPITNLGILGQKTVGNIQRLINPLIRFLLPKNAKQRRKIRVKSPTLPNEPYIYASLLSKMANQLQEYERHSHFDYLSFYRRAMALVQHIRGEVLFDESMELFRFHKKEAETSNISLCRGCLRICRLNLSLGMLRLGVMRLARTLWL